MEMNSNKHQINRKKMGIMVIFIFSFSHLPILNISAQTFTQRVQQKTKTGEGTVVIYQSKDIDELVNGKGNAPQTVRTQDSRKDPQKEKDNNDERDTLTGKTPERSIQEHHRDSTEASEPIDTHKKVMKGGYKVNGYRVQAYAGGNQRKNRQAAERIGNLIKQHYPGEPIYVHFYSPRWICRVGNYRSYEEAHRMLTNIRKLGVSGASIVKGKITVQY
jgi:hypothetical protein